MERSADELMSAARGTIIVNDTTELTQDFFTIVVLEDTVFASIKADGVDIKDDLITTAATAVKAGAIIKAAGYITFSGVQLTSGSISIVL